MISPAILSQTGINRFSDYTSQIPSYMRGEADVVELLQLMSDYINNAYRDSQSSVDYTFELITTESNKKSTISKMHSLRNLMLNAKQSGNPVLYVTDSDANESNPLVLTNTMKISLTIGSDIGKTIFSSDNIELLNVNDIVVDDSGALASGTRLIGTSNTELVFSNVSTETTEVFLTFIPSDSAFDDVLSFIVKSIGSVQEIPLERDVAEGTIYYKIFFDISLKSMVTDISRIDIRENKGNIDYALQSGKVKFRIPDSPRVYGSGNVYSTVPNRIELESVYDKIEKGYKVVDNGGTNLIPDGTYVTGVYGNKITLSENPLLPALYVGDYYRYTLIFYPENEIIPTEDSVSIISSIEGVGNFKRNISIGASADWEIASIDQATEFTYYVEENADPNVIVIENFEASIHSNTVVKIDTGNDERGSFLRGNILEIFIKHDNGLSGVTYSKYDYKITDTEFNTGITYITIDKTFSYSLASNDSMYIRRNFEQTISDQIEINSELYKLLHIDYINDNTNTQLTIEPLLTNVDDITSSGTFTSKSYYINVGGVDDPDIGDVIFINIPAASNSTKYIFISEGGSRLLEFDSNATSNFEMPLRFEYTGNDWRWVDIDTSTGLFEYDYIHKVVSSNKVVELLHTNARNGDVLTIHTDIDYDNLSLPLISSTGILSETAISGNTITITSNSFEEDMPVMFSGDTRELDLDDNSVYFIINRTINTVQLTTIRGDAGAIITIDNTNATSLSTINLEEVIAYVQSNVGVMGVRGSSEKIKSYTSSFVFGNEWIVSTPIETLHSGRGIFYSRANTNSNVPPELLNNKRQSIFKDSYIGVNPVTWRGAFSTNWDYEVDSYVSYNGNIYKSIAYVRSNTDYPNNNISHWRVVDDSVYTTSLSGDNPYVFGLLDILTVTSNDYIKSNYSFTVESYTDLLKGRVLNVNGDVRRIFPSGSDILVNYKVNYTSYSIAFIVDVVVYDAGLDKTQITISTKYNYISSFTDSDVDIINNSITVPLSYANKYPYGSRVHFVGDLLPSIIDSDIPYYVASIDSTGRVLKFSTDPSDLDTFVNLTDTGSGNIVLDEEVPYNSYNQFIEFIGIDEKFIIAKDTDVRFDINATQRAWLFNPRNAPDSSLTRNGWLSTVNKYITSDTREFYCRKNLFKPDENIFAYTASGGELKPAWYKYNINTLSNFSSTSYSDIGSGYTMELEFIDSSTFDEIRIKNIDLRDVFSSSQTTGIDGVSGNYTSNARNVVNLQFGDSDSIITSHIISDVTLDEKDTIITFDSDVVTPVISTGTTSIGQKRVEISTSLSGLFVGNEVIIVDASDNVLTINGTSIVSIGIDHIVLSDRVSGSTSTDGATIITVNSLSGTIFNVDKKYMKIPKLTIELDNNRALDDTLDDDEKYAIYADVSVVGTLPEDTFALPSGAVKLITGVYESDVQFIDADVISICDDELIDVYFEKEYIKNIDTLNNPAVEYDARRDSNTSILAVDENGDYIHSNVRINSDFDGIPDMKYSLVEKIERLAYQKDPNVIDMDLIGYLARYLGYDITTLQDDIESSPQYVNKKEREMALRKTIQNLPEFNSIKTTSNGIEAIVLAFGIVGRVVSLWTSKDSPYLNLWLDNSSLPNVIKRSRGMNPDYVATPHFKFRVDIESNSSSSACDAVLVDSDIVTAGDLSRVRKTIIRNKPINTVFDGIIINLDAIICKFIGRPTFENKTRSSFSVGFDVPNMMEYDSIISEFNECNC